MEWCLSVDGHEVRGEESGCKGGEFVELGGRRVGTGERGGLLESGREGGGRSMGLWER